VGEDAEVAELLRTVISHRLLTQDDATPFDACILFGFLGGLDTLVEQLGPLAERAFVRTENPCDPPLLEGPRVELYGVRLGGGDSVTRVMLQVIGPEGTHREEYILRPPPVIIEGMTRWVVDDVRRS
jgi:hypothetical protein